MNYQPLLNSQRIMFSAIFWLGVGLKLRGIVLSADNVGHTHCKKNDKFLGLAFLIVRILRNIGNVLIIFPIGFVFYAKKVFCS